MTNDIIKSLNFQKIISESPWEIFEEIAKIEIDAFDKDALTAINLKLLSVAGILYVCSFENKIIAEALVLNKIYKKNEALLFSFAVKREYRNQNVGSSLLEYLLKDLINLKIRNLFLTVDPQNLPALKLYKKFGFVELYFKNDFFGTNLNRIIMVKNFKNNSKE